MANRFNITDLTIATALQERIVDLKEEKRKIRKNAEDNGIIL